MSAGFVYAIQAVDGGPVKLGFTNSPEGRLAQLQGGHYQELRVVRDFEAEPEDERRLHELLSEVVVRGEWFTDCGELWQAFETVRATSRIRLIGRSLQQQVFEQFEDAVRGSFQSPESGRISVFSEDVLAEEFEQAREAVAVVLDELTAQALADVHIQIERSKEDVLS